MIISSCKNDCTNCRCVFANMKTVTSRLDSVSYHMSCVSWHRHPPVYHSQSSPGFAHSNTGDLPLCHRKDFTHDPLATEKKLRARMDNMLCVLFWICFEWTSPPQKKKKRYMFPDAPWCWNIYLLWGHKYAVHVGQYSSTMVRIWGCFCSIPRVHGFPQNGKTNQNHQQIIREIGPADRTSRSPGSCG